FPCDIENTLPERLGVDLQAGERGPFNQQIYPALAPVPQEGLCAPLEKEVQDRACSAAALRVERRQGTADLRDRVVALQQGVMSRLTLAVTIGAQLPDQISGRWSAWFLAIYVMSGKHCEQQRNDKTRDVHHGDLLPHQAGGL